MDKKILRDLEYMASIRRRTVEEYEKSLQKQQEIDRLMEEGIKNFNELVFYIRETLRASNELNVRARDANNELLYIESVAVRREFKILLNLILLGEEDNTGRPEKEEPNNMEVV
ncbi:MAG: hypothetical protein DRP09_16105 [Candidatus Thorarchaeota archaeon]|nr:MAG: hypothetical protein DRP09_16105 [Candidatus Thorarchaeota archaeon]